MEKARRVVFFDSGVGGLSVYRDVKKLNPVVEGYYIFDNECFPYGTKTPEFLEERVCSILRRMRELYAPAAVVIACNTASTVVSVLRFRAVPWEDGFAARKSRSASDSGAGAVCKGFSGKAAGDSVCPMRWIRSILILPFPRLFHSMKRKSRLCGQGHSANS